MGVGTVSPAVGGHNEPHTCFSMARTGGRKSAGLTAYRPDSLLCFCLGPRPHTVRVTDVGDTSSCGRRRKKKEALVAHARPRVPPPCTPPGRLDTAKKEKKKKKKKYPAFIPPLKKKKKKKKK